MWRNTYLSRNLSLFYDIYRKGSHGYEVFFHLWWYLKEQLTNAYYKNFYFLDIKIDLEVWWTLDVIIEINILIMSILFYISIFLIVLVAVSRVVK